MLSLAVDSQKSALPGEQGGRGGGGGQRSHRRGRGRDSGGRGRGAAADTPADAQLLGKPPLRRSLVHQRGHKEKCLPKHHDKSYHMDLEFSCLCVCACFLESLFQCSLCDDGV